MGEHGSWTDLLSKLPGWGNLEHNLKGIFGREDEALIFTVSHFTLTHILWALAVMLFVTYGAVRFNAAVAARDGIVPAPRFGVRALFEMVLDTAYGLMAQV